jgi:hypothetical protein
MALRPNKLLKSSIPRDLHLPGGILAAYPVRVVRYWYSAILPTPGRLTINYAVKPLIAALVLNFTSSHPSHVAGSTLPECPSRHVDETARCVVDASTKLHIRHRRNLTLRPRDVTDSGPAIAIGSVKAESTRTSRTVLSIYQGVELVQANQAQSLALV